MYTLNPKVLTCLKLFKDLGLNVCSINNHVLLDCLKDDKFVFNIIFDVLEENKESIKSIGIKDVFINRYWVLYKDGEMLKIKSDSFIDHLKDVEDSFSHSDAKIIIQFKQNKNY